MTVQWQVTMKAHVCAPIDLSQFPNLPAEVVNAFTAVQFELSVERAARQHEQAVVAEKDAFITQLKELIEKLESQVQDYRRTKFGAKSEKLDPTSDANSIALKLQTPRRKNFGYMRISPVHRQCVARSPKRFNMSVPSKGRE